MKFSYLIGLLLFLMSCSLPTMPCNPKDENGACYLASPSGVVINSCYKNQIRSE